MARNGGEDRPSSVQSNGSRNGSETFERRRAAGKKSSKAGRSSLPRQEGRDKRISANKTQPPDFSKPKKAPRRPKHSGKGALTHNRNIYGAAPGSTNKSLLNPVRKAREKQENEHKRMLERSRNRQRKQKQQPPQSQIQPDRRPSSGAGGGRGTTGMKENVLSSSKDVSNETAYDAPKAGTCSDKTDAQSLQKAIVQQHRHLGIPTELVYTHASSRVDLPAILFRNIATKEEYTFYGDRKKRPGPSGGSQSSNRNLNSTTGDASSNAAPEDVPSPPKSKQENVSAPPAPGDISSTAEDGAPYVALSPTGKVRRGSSLRTHIPGCTCMRCRKARTKPNRLPTRLRFRVLGPNECKIVVATMQKNRFAFTTRKGNDWNVSWVGTLLRSYEYQGLNRYQRVAQFPRTFEITRKDTLSRNMARMKELHGSRWFSFVPEGFVLPNEWGLFTQAYQSGRHSPSVAWIVKPAALSCGRGIFVTQDIDEIKALNMSESPWQVSRYVNDPLLINGFKFDLRIYACVTSFNPLRIYVHDEGLTRFATAPYDPSPAHFDNRFMHLTNYSVNKHNENFKFNEGMAEGEDSMGSKWSLHALRRKLRELNIDDKKLWQKIYHVINMTMISIEPQVNSAIDMFVPFKSRNCFQLFGFDILIDESLEPTLIEVNFSPSLACGTPLDLHVKSHVIADTLSLAMVQPYDHAKMDGRVGKSARSKNQGKPGKGTKKKDKRKKKKKVEQKRQVYGGGDFDNRGNNASPATRTREERRAILELECELRCKGGFQLTYPNAEMGSVYRQFFEEIRPLNDALCDYLLQRNINSEPASTSPVRIENRDVRTSRLEQARALKERRLRAETDLKNSFKYIF